MVTGAEDEAPPTAPTEAGEASRVHTEKIAAMGVLAAGVAHDLNNLLTPILLAHELLRSRLAGDAEALDALEHAEHAARRAAELTRQLLVSSAQVPTTVEPMALADVVRELAPAAPPRARLVVELAPALPLVRADRAQVRELIHNLLANAYEALPPEGGTVTVEAEAVTATAARLASPFVTPAPAPGEYVALRIIDTGVGIAAEHQGRIFDPFFSTKFTGRGLGLAAVLGIVRAHHGTLHLTSQVGRGTTVEVLLPRAAATAAEVAPAARAPTRLTGRVLVVDDEPALRRTVERTLRRAGLDVLTAGDGREGLEVYARHAGSIDLVVLDLTMPRLDGAAMLAELRRIAPAQPVILMTGYATEAVLASLGDLRPDGVLQKPFSVHPLLATIERCLADHRR